VPPESAVVRAAAPAAEPPAHAVAQCRDGSFVVEPAGAAACQARGGVLVVLPPRAAARPPAPGGRAQALPAAARATAPMQTAPPPGATMQCGDGTYLTGPADIARCAANGGVAAILPTPAPPPPAPVRPRLP
jgi:hypothetical protein